MEIGIDIIDISILSETKINRLISHLLSEEEKDNQNTLSLLGKIATKEALVKASVIKPGEWKKVAILNDDSGKPYVYDEFMERRDDIKISISHSNKTVVAVAIYIPEYA